MSLPVSPQFPSSPFELPPVLVEALLPRSQPLTSPKGTSIYGQGERCRGAFIVRSGSCQMTIRAANGSEVYQRTLGPGTILGLSATLCDHEYTSTAVTLEDSELAWIDTSSFQDFVRSRPDLSIVIVAIMSREVTDMNLRRANLASCRACGCPLADACSHHFPNS